MFNQKEYIKEYQKENYKMYAFRVKKDDKSLIKKIESIKNKNDYFVSLIKKDDILTIKKIKEIIMPILNSKGIKEIYLFGSYARGEADSNSDVDIYCEIGNVKNLYDVVDLNEELEKRLKKDVDLIFSNSRLEKTFEENMRKDLIKLC